jgi:aminoglycoside phosphotransferase (APT) family kinase protein
MVEASAATLPTDLRLLAEELAAAPVDDGGLTRDDRERLVALTPAFDDWCAELAASPVPDSVQHDDLHSGNVCCPPAGPEVVIDWGDTTWGCPLATMLTTMNSLAFHAGLYTEGEAVDAPQVLRARDAYLEPFTRYADRAALVRLVDLARRTGCVGKALSYRRALQEAPLGTHAELDHPVRAWLLEVLG